MSSAFFHMWSLIGTWSKIVLSNLMITINVSICRYEEHLHIFIMQQKLSNATIIAFPENCLFRELLSWSPHVVAFCGDWAFLIHSQPFLHSHLSDIFVIFKAAFFKNARNAASRNLAIRKQLRKMPMVVPETCIKYLQNIKVWVKIRKIILFGFISSEVPGMHLVTD